MLIFILVNSFLVVQSSRVFDEGMVACTLPRNKDYYLLKGVKKKMDKLLLEKVVCVGREGCRSVLIFARLLELKALTY